MRKLLTISLALCAAFIAAGCEERYRYPCMDTKNWDRPECKRPQCAITNTCPDQLIKPEEMKGDDK